jgi:hypothetical protein
LVVISIFTGVRLWVVDAAGFALAAGADAAGFALATLDAAGWTLAADEAGFALATAADPLFDTAAAAGPDAEEPQPTKARPNANVSQDQCFVILSRSLM